MLVTNGWVIDNDNKFHENLLFSRSAIGYPSPRILQVEIDYESNWVFFLRDDGKYTYSFGNPEQLIIMCRQKD